MNADEIFAQLEAIAARQYGDDEPGRLRFLVDALKTKIRECDYRAERAREQLRQTLSPDKQEPA